MVQRNRAVSVEPGESRAAPTVRGDEERAHPRQLEEIAKSLQGKRRAEHLFVLKQTLDAFDFIGTQVAEFDSQIEHQIQMLQVHEGEPAKGEKRGRARNAPRFDLRTQLFMSVAWTYRIDGLDVTMALAVISETDADVSGSPATSTSRAGWACVRAAKSRVARR